MKTRADHVDFIRRNGPEVAALAWERHEEKGRGMVCVIAEEHNEVLGTVPYDFLPATDAPKIIHPWEGSKEQGMVEGYDPATELVICVIRKGEGGRTEIDSYRIRPRPTPPEAAERA